MKIQLASDLHSQNSVSAFEKQLQEALTCLASDEDALVLELGDNFFAEFLLLLQDLMNCCLMGSISNRTVSSNDANSTRTDQLEDPFKTPVRLHRRLKPTFVAERVEAVSNAVESPANSNLQLEASSNSPFVESTVFSSALDEAIFNRAIKTPTKESAESKTAAVFESAEMCNLPLSLSRLAKLHFSCSTLHHCRDLWTSVKAIFVFLQCERFELLPGYSNYLCSVVSFDATSIRKYGVLALKLHQPILQHLPTSILAKALNSEHFLMLRKTIAANASAAQAHTVPKSCSPNDSDFSIPISLSADSKRHLKTSMQIQTFSNQQKIRDDFFDILRSFLPNFSGEFGELGSRVRQLQEKIHHQNMHWFAGVFVEEYINICFVSRASNLSSSFPAAATSNLEKMQKLESRFSIRGNDEFSVVFMGKELFFVKFMQAFDSLSISEGLLKQFFAKLLQLAASILKKRTTFTENWHLLKGISKAISSSSPNALTHAFILDSRKGIFNFCCKNSFRFFYKYAFPKQQDFLSHFPPKKLLCLLQKKNKTLLINQIVMNICSPTNLSACCFPNCCCNLPNFPLFKAQTPNSRNTIKPSLPLERFAHILNHSLPPEQQLWQPLAAPRILLNSMNQFKLNSGGGSCGSISKSRNLLIALHMQ